MNIPTLPQLPQDKANHVLYGLAAGLAGAFAATKIGYIEPAIAAVSLAVLVGAAKEITDKVWQMGEPSIPDALATAAGGVVIAVAVVM